MKKISIITFLILLAGCVTINKNYYHPPLLECKHECKPVLQLPFYQWPSYQWPSITYPIWRGNELDIDSVYKSRIGSDTTLYLNHGLIKIDSFFHWNYRLDTTTCK